MSRPLKCGKASEVKQKSYTDRISSLPDELLGYMLSFLPTECAVGTSILSTRWRCLHMLTNCLDFYGPDQYCEKKSIDPNKSFMKFVYRVLLFHKVSPIKKFHLYCHKHAYDDSHLHAWISVAISKRVEQLRLNLKCQLNPLPHSIFSCRTIVDLKINTYYIIDFQVPESIHMPSLKVLHLSGINFVDRDSFANLLSACPLLQELEIGVCNWAVKSDGHVRVYHGALKHVVLNYFEDRIEFDVPNLAYVEYHCSDDVGAALSLKNTDSLVTASLDLSFSTNSGLIKHALALMKAVHHVKQLYLLNDTTQYLACFKDDQMLSYPNLANLCLGHCSYDTWKYIMYWLANSPRLKKIVFEESLINDTKNEKWPPSVALVPFSSGVEVIQVSNFRGSTIELVLLRYILENAKLLKKLIVKTDPNYMTEKKEFEACKELLMLPRASTTCVVQFTETR